MIFTRSINLAGLNLVKYFEGFRNKPYLCSANYLTIGYGHKINIDESFQQITRKQANILLRQDLLIAEQAVLRNINNQLTDNQFSALVSFTYNLGGAALQRSSLRQKINYGDYQAVAYELLRWVHAQGKVNLGLIRRRQAEVKLFYQDH